MARKAAKRTVEQFVLDGSVTLAWFFKDEADPYADAIAARFPDVQGLVPAVWPLEVANAVLMGERRRRSTEAQAARVPLEREPVLAPGGRISIGELLTEELLLLLPIVPLHEDRERCASESAAAGPAAAAGEIHRPFANLADLFKR